MQVSIPASLREYIKSNGGMILRKITAFIGSLGGGGAQGVFLTVMDYYANLGYEINAVISTMSNDVHSNELNKSIRITNLDANSSRDSLPKIIRYIKNSKIELAFAFSPELAVNVIIGRVISGKKFPIIARCINTLSYEYSHAEGLFRRYVTNNLVKIYYHKAEMVVAQAERMRQDLIDNYHFSANQVVTINNPLGDKFSKEIGNIAINKRENYILYVGRYEKQKGLNMLLSAFSNIQDNIVNLLLIGRGSQEKELKEVINQLGLAKRVKILPFSMNIEEYYKKARLTVMSSYFEGFPNVLSESIACGTPVVSFDLPSGPSDIVINGENGFLANYLDVDDLTHKIDCALEKDWNYMSIKNTAERFKKDRILPMYRDLIEKMEIV